MFLCSFAACNAVYKQRCHLIRHNESSHVDPVICSRCNKQFKNRFALEKHFQSHETRVYACCFAGCNRAFLKHQHLKVHEYQHTGVKPFACSICLKRFEVPSKLKRHLKVHAGYKCTVDGCGKVLTTWTLVRKHIASDHANSFSCEVCGSQFPKFRYLQKHHKKHQHEHEPQEFKLPTEQCNQVTAVEDLNNRRFCCDVPRCFKRFKTSGHLKRHHQTVHLKVAVDRARVPCDFEGCQKLFQTRQKMLDHKNVHYDLKPYQCLISGCYKAYTKRDALKWHCLTAHKQPLKSLQLRQKLEN